jgi:D-alanine-D-alanine ligase
VVPQQATERFVYSLEMKRDWRNQIRYECPPEGYSDELIDRIEKSALRAFAALGCRDVSRIDFRLRDGVPYFLEANPLPGLNPESGDLVIIADAMGVSHTDLIGGILEAALERTGELAASN